MKQTVILILYILDSMRKQFFFIYTSAHFCHKTFPNLSNPPFPRLFLNPTPYLCTLLYPRPFFFPSPSPYCPSCISLSTPLLRVLSYPSLMLSRSSSLPALLHSVKIYKCTRYNILYFPYDISGLVVRNAIGSIVLASQS